MLSQLEINGYVIVTGDEREILIPRAGGRYYYFGLYEGALKGSFPGEYLLHG